MGALWLGTLSSSQSLRLATADSEVLLNLSIEQVPYWSIRWQHSVAGIWIRDDFRWQDGVLLFTDSYSPLLDVAGLGDTAGRGEVKEDGQGNIWISDINEPIPGNRYALRVGSSTAPTLLLHAGQVYNLSEQYAGMRLWLEVHHD